MKQELDDLLQIFGDELGKALGSNLERVILYGSRARGDEDPDSDLDVLVVLRNTGRTDREEIHRIAFWGGLLRDGETSLGGVENVFRF